MVPDIEREWIREELRESTLSPRPRWRRLLGIVVLVLILAAAATC